MLFSFSEYAHISNALCGLPCLQPGHFSITRRENRELHAAVQSPVSSERCFILGTIAPPEHQMAVLPIGPLLCEKLGSLDID